jgi:hypothetical protein
MINRRGPSNNKLMVEDQSSWRGELRELVTSSAQEVARAVGLLLVLQRPQQITALPPDPANVSEALSLRQEILEGGMSTSLEVDAIVAQINNEVAQARELRGYLGTVAKARTLIHRAQQRLVECVSDSSGACAVLS